MDELIPLSMTKKCHPIRYHSDIKYYMTLNIIGSVGSMHTEEYDII